MVFAVNIIEAKRQNLLTLMLMQGYNLSIPAVQQTILTSTWISHRKHSNSRSKILIRLAGKYKSVDELRNLVISQRWNRNSFKRHRRCSRHAKK
jgi:HAE1 family hydrophobic/amphiphilic exporter-1